MIFIKGSFKLKITLLFAGVLLVVFVLTFSLFRQQIKNYQYEIVRTKLKLEGDNFLYHLKDLDLEDIHNLDQDRKTLLSNEDFKIATIRLLDYSQKFDIDKYFVYTMVKKQRKEYYFILIGDGEYSLRFDDPFLIGDEVYPYFEKAYQTGQIQYPPVYTDKKGKWLTVVIPIKDEQGRVYAIHEPCLKVEYVDSIVQAALRGPLIITSLIFLIALILVWILINVSFRPFNRILNLLKRGRQEQEMLIGKIKASGEFEVLRSALESYTRSTKSIEEVNQILSHVQEGLFLLRSNLTVGAVHSRFTSAIFQMDSISGQNIITIIEKYLTKKKVDNLKKFLELIFSGKHDEKMLSTLNPLKSAEFLFNQNSGDFNSKHLEFNFAAIKENTAENRDKSIQYMMVTIKDITEVVLLNRKLDKNKIQTENKIQKLFKIIHIDPQILFEFIESSETIMVEINELLKKNYHSKEDYLILLNNLFQKVHTIKGNSALLNLTFIEEQAHKYENQIEDILRKDIIGGQDFIDIVFALDELKSEVKNIKELVEKLKRFNSPSGVSNASIGQEIINLLETMAKKTAQIQGKEVQFNQIDMDINQLPYKKIELLRNVLVQILRNSISHGIETPEEREKKGKAKKGQITLRGIEEKEFLQISIKDDGRGIEVEKLKQIAISQGIVEENEIANWSEEKIVSLIFMDNFSSKQQADLHSGRGVGMSIVKSQIEQMGGELKVDFKKDLFSEFLIKIPL